MQAPPTITEVVANDEQLGFHLEYGRFISVPVAFYPTLALATPEQRGHYEINASSAYWPELDADIGVEGMLLGGELALGQRAVMVFANEDFNLSWTFQPLSIAEIFPAR